MPVATSPTHTGTPNPLAKRLAGRILLQVQDHGKAWYVSPVDYQRYYLGSPADAVQVMRKLGLGISNATFAQFRNNTAPSRLAGRILLKVEDKGRAYYVNPKDLKLNYLSPESALEIMRTLGLGVSNVDLQKVGSAGTTGGAIFVSTATDADGDGLSDVNERTLGSDEYRTDTDCDSHSDGQEVNNGYNPLGNGVIANGISTLHDGWNRYTAPSGYTIDFPDGYAPRVVDPLPGNGSTVAIANFNAQYAPPSSADRVRVLVSSRFSMTPAPSSIEQLRSMIHAYDAYPDLGVVGADVQLGSAIRVSMYTHDREGHSEMSYFACDDQKGMCYTLSSADPGFSVHRDLVEQIVSTFVLH